MLLLVTVKEEEEVPAELLTGFIGVIAVGLVVVVVRWRSGLMLDGSRLQLRSLLHMRRTATGSSLGLLSSWWRQKLYSTYTVSKLYTQIKASHLLQNEALHSKKSQTFANTFARAKLCGPDGGGFEWLRT